MKRLSLIVTLALGTAQMAQAQDKAAECALQSDVVNRVVAARADGMASDKAIRTVAGDLTGDTKKYAGIVPDLAGWIYSLPEEQLTDAVGAEWSKVCLGM